MRLDKTETIRGVRMMVVRDLLRGMGPGSVSAGFVKDRTGADIVDALVARGWLKPKYSRNGTQYYSSTVAGDAVGNAHFVKPLPRARADRLAAEMLRRADAINADADLIYRIKTIRAFGSYITDSPDVGDIDLEVELEYKREKGDRPNEVNRARARASGKTMSYWDEGRYGEREVKLLLKGRSPYLSFHVGGQIELIGCDSRVLYPRKIAK